MPLVGTFVLYMPMYMQQNPVGSYGSISAIACHDTNLKFWFP
jgi:hypothetical protein